MSPQIGDVVKAASLGLMNPSKSKFTLLNSYSTDFEIGGIHASSYNDDGYAYGADAEQFEETPSWLQRRKLRETQNGKEDNFFISFIAKYILKTDVSAAAERSFGKREEMALQNIRTSLGPNGGDGTTTFMNPQLKYESLNADLSLIAQAQAEIFLGAFEATAIEAGLGGLGHGLSAGTRAFIRNAALKSANNPAARRGFAEVVENILQSRKATPTPKLDPHLRMEALTEMANAGDYAGLARAGTNIGENADTVILGKFDYVETTDEFGAVVRKELDTAYTAVARQQKATHFSFTDDEWNHIERIVGDGNMWQINKQFLEQQKALGVKFKFSHNPNDLNVVGENSFYHQELNYLGVTDNNTHKVGNFWELKY